MIFRTQRIVRRGWRLAAFAGVLAFYAAAFVLVPSNRRSLATRARWLSRICRSLLKAMGVRSATIGSVAPGTVIASNHLGYLDILVLAAQTPTVFVARHDVRDWPVFGWFARMAGTRFIDRTRRSDVARVAQQFVPALESGVSVVLFLEGTSSDGSAVLPFRSSLLEPILRSRLSVTPVAISYVVPRGHSAANEVCWWGDMTLTPHLLNLLSLPTIHAYVGWGEPIGDAADRKALAANAHTRVSALHRAMTRCVDGLPETATKHPSVDLLPRSQS